jgi:GGDEF domain-containing protein
MNFGGYEFQVIFCALILLGLAAVAIVVDYLKGMNEKLRERQIDLQARHEVALNRIEEDNARLLRALAEQSKAFREMNRRSIQVNTKLAVAAMPELTLEPIKSIEPALAETGPAAVAAPPATESLPPNVIRIRLKKEAEAEMPQPNFDQFLERLVEEFDQTPAASPDLASLAAKVEEQSPSLLVPLGSYPVNTLNELLEKPEPYTGLAFSVGINDYSRLEQVHGAEASEKLRTTVDALMAECVEGKGFCTRRREDEFVLLFPNLGGAAAHQLTQDLAEKLWDFQLQSLGTFHAVFSWGATYAQRQPLSTALETATENMGQTRGSRSNDPHRATA